MKARLGLVESVLFALVFAISLSIVLARSPLWDIMPSLAGLLPARYVAVLDLLPVETNTALAFVTLTIATLAILVLMAQPAIPLATLAAAALGVGAYPYGRIRWHEAFGVRLFEDAVPGTIDWVAGFIPILLLLVAPVWVHTRTVIGHYKDKGIEPHELRRVRIHIIKNATTRGITATAFTVAMGIVLFAASGQLAFLAQAFGRNSVLAMLAIAILLIAAIGMGTGAFRRNRLANETPEGPPSQAQDS